MSLSDDLATRWTPSKEQDREAAAALAARVPGDDDSVVTAHLLINKESGWWGPQVQIEHLPGLFADRNEASDALIAAAEAKHKETGQPVVGGYTYHRASDIPALSADGTRWLTHWAVFEDILAVFPEPEWRRR